MARQHAHGETPVAPSPQRNLTTTLWERVAAHHPNEVLRYWHDGSWRGLTWTQVGDRVRQVASGLLAVGVARGDRVALMSSTRMDWCLADLAVLSIGAVTVPVDETWSAPQCAAVLADSGASVVIVDSAARARQVESARAQTPDVTEIFVLDDAGLDAIAERGTERTRQQVPERAAATGSGDLATIIYGRDPAVGARGCMLTHANLAWVVRQALTVLAPMVGRDDATLLFLPLADIQARLVQLLCLEANVPIGYARSPQTVAEDLQSFGPTFLLCGPGALENLFDSAQGDEDARRPKVFDFAMSSAAQWTWRIDPSPLDTIRHAIADKLVYRKLRVATGGQLRYCVSAGEPVAPHLAAFFQAAEINLLEGYGLPESSALATLNVPEATKLATAGRPLPGVEVRIAEDGEILLKGPSVFAGYWNDPDASARAFTADGWLRTGDLGELDDEGFLTVTARSRDRVAAASR